MNRYPHVFQPLTVGNIVLKNRLECTPFVCAHCTSEGGVDQGMIDFVRMQARTGVANLVIGNIVDPDRGMNCYADLDFSHDRFTAGLSLLADAAHEYGAKISYELCHSGRGNVPSVGAVDTGMTDDVPVPQKAATVNLMNRDDMAWMKARFADYCKRVKRAGFDMIFMHIGHNNLIGSFLSPDTNQRTDAYGGSLENRLRYPLEMLHTIRDAIGPEMPIEVRVSAEEKTAQGATMKEAMAFLTAAEPYINLAHFSCGNVFADESRVYTSPMYTMEHKQNVGYAAEAKKQLKIPVTVVGNIRSVQDAEEILAAGQADVVGICRSLLADPELIHKALEGREDTIRPCLKCMDGCGRIFHGFPARCAVNPTLGRETACRFLQPAKTRKHVMVIGGGAAGMQAAQTLCARGHRVDLYEKSDRLGGLLHDAGAVSYKDLLRSYRDWDIRTTDRCGASIHLNTEVTEELVERVKPDAVILAAGAVPIRPRIPGVELPHVKMLREVDRDDSVLGARVVVCGGGLSGVEAAVDYARKGHSVTVVDRIPREQFCAEAFFFAYEALFIEVAKSGVALRGSCQIRAFTPEGLEVETPVGIETIAADTVVLALGRKPETALAEKLLAKDPLHTFLVGDAVGVKNIRYANESGYFAALRAEEC